MKRVLGILLLFISYNLQGQNYLGYTQIQLDYALENDMTVTKIKERVLPSESTYEVKTNNSDVYYYTIKDSMCISFALVCYDLSQLNGYIKHLNEKYVSISDNKWIDYNIRNVGWEIDKRGNLFMVFATYLSK